MLKVFRDNLKSLAWILWVIIALFILGLAVQFGGNIRGTGNTATAATVGRDTVSMEEFLRSYRQIENIYRQAYGDQLTPEMEKQMRLPLQAVDRAINQKILMAEARRLGLTVSDAELQDRILKEPAFQDERGRFVGEERYRQILAQNQLSTAGFEDEMRQELLLRKLTDALSTNLFISEDEVQRAYRDQVERAKIRYVQLPSARFASTVPISPAELAAYFAAHKAELRLPEQRDAAYLLVDAGRLADQAKPADAEVRRYYDSHQDEFKQEEQVKARHILVMVNDKRSDAQARQRIEEAKKRLQGGADFAAVAGEYSEDPASKGSGGDLGWFGRNRMVKEFEDAAFGAETGKLVGPVKSSFGYHLLEVTDKRPGGQRPFEEVKEQIRARLGAEKVQQLAEAKAKELAGRLASDKPRSAADLRALAQQNPGVTYAESGRFGAQDPVPGLGPNPAFAASAFSLKKGEVSQAVQVPQGWVILYLKDVYPARTPVLADVEPRVRAALARQKMQAEAMRRLEEARRQMAQGKTLDQVAAELGVEAKETAEFGGQGMIPGIGNNPELVRSALSLQAGQIGGPVADAQGALLFQVTEHKGWDPKQYASNREQTRATLMQDRLGRLQAALIAQRRRELNVTYDRRFLEQYGITQEQQG